MSDLPLRADLIAAPKTCEMCGTVLEPHVDTYERVGATAELLRYLAAMWFENHLFPQLLLIRISQPAWTYDQMAEQLQVSRAMIGRAMGELERNHPEIASMVHVYARKPDAQKARRHRETLNAETRTMQDGTTWRTTTWARTQARLRARLATNSRAR